MKIDPEKAIAYYKEGLAVAKEIDAKYMIWIFYQDLYIFYMKKQNYKEALEYHIKYTEIDKEVFSEESNKKIAELSIKYETEKKGKEIIQKTNEIKLLQQEKG